MFVYLELVEFVSHNVVKRLDVSKHTPRSRGVIEDGLNINLNHNKYYTRLVECIVARDLI